MIHLIEKGNNMFKFKNDQIVYYMDNNKICSGKILARSCVEKTNNYMGTVSLKFTHLGNFYQIVNDIYILNTNYLKILNFWLII